MKIVLTTARPISIILHFWKDMPCRPLSGTAANDESRTVPVKMKNGGGGGIEMKQCE